MLIFLRFGTLFGIWSEALFPEEDLMKHLQTIVAKSNIVKLIQGDKASEKTREAMKKVLLTAERLDNK